MALPTVTLPHDWTVSSQSLAERTILITGASGGLGRAAALACAQAGATVVLAGRKVRPLEKVHDELLALQRAEPIILPLDLEGASPDDYATVVEALQSAGGGLHGIVHAAAHFDGLTPLAHEKPEDWMRDLHVNLTAPFLLVQACLPLLQESEDAAVVFVLDDRERLAGAYWNGYGVAKAGLERLVSILHEELESANPRIHALLPGPMRTPLRRKAWFAEDPADVAPAAETAPAVVYLLAPEAAPTRGKLLDLRA